MPSLHDENKATVSRFWDRVVGNGDMKEADKILAGGCTLNCVGEPTMRIDSRGDIKEFVRLVNNALSDVEVTVHDQIAEEDKVAARWTLKGIYDQEIMRMPPTGKRLVAEGMSVFTISDGIIEEVSMVFGRRFEPPDNIQALIHHWLWR